MPLKHPTMLEHDVLSRVVEVRKPDDEAREVATTTRYYIEALDGMAMFGATEIDPKEKAQTAYHVAFPLEPELASAHLGGARRVPSFGHSNPDGSPRRAFLSRRSVYDAGFLMPRIGLVGAKSTLRGSVVEPKPQI